MPRATLPWVHGSPPRCRTSRLAHPRSPPRKAERARTTLADAWPPGNRLSASKVISRARRSPRSSSQDASSSRARSRFSYVLASSRERSHGRSSGTAATPWRPMDDPARGAERPPGGARRKRADTKADAAGVRRSDPRRPPRRSTHPLGTRAGHRNRSADTECDGGAGSTGYSGPRAASGLPKRRATTAPQRPGLVAPGLASQDRVPEMHNRRVFHVRRVRRPSNASVTSSSRSSQPQWANDSS